jgi:hypothetical protein
MFGFMAFYLYDAEWLSIDKLIKYICGDRGEKKESKTWKQSKMEFNLKIQLF